MESKSTAFKSADAVIERAVRRGLTEDRTKIDPRAVRRNLRPKSKYRYSLALQVWHSYERKYGPSDPRDMQVMKHFAETVGLGMIGKLDEEDELPTPDSLRGSMRRFYNAWERHYNLEIPLNVKRSMAPYIQGELAEKLGLKNLHKEQAFLTIENYVILHEQLWFKDHHDYVHEGFRIDNANLLNTHCSSSARLQELCQSRYKDFVLLVGWKDGEPELKLKVKRRVCKGKDFKQPEHVLPEKISSKHGPPPLYAQPMLFWLANIISSEAIKGNPTLDEVLAMTPPSDGQNHWVLEWEESKQDKAAFPMWDSYGPKEKNRSPTSWAQQISAWAIRARFTDGVGLHCARREVLVKTNDGGYSVEQILKFADQQNSSVLRRHYLGTMNTVDGAASYLGMDIRNDLTEDFRSATMKWNSDLPLELRAKEKAELEHNEQYTALTRLIERLSLQINDENTPEEARQRLREQRSLAYSKRRKLERNKLRECQQNQPKVYPTERKAYEENDWRRDHFLRVLHMMPERKRLFHTLSLRVPLRSPQGISALRDLITLRKSDCRVAYQDVLKPKHGCCPTPSCEIDMESIPPTKRWKHTYRCSETFYKKEYGFAQFCFLCSCWITSQKAWLSHCQNHIDEHQVPFRCNPVYFRHALACAGYCPIHIGRTDLPANIRMQQYLDTHTWKSHISECISAYINARVGLTSIACPHPECPCSFGSGENLKHHLRDVHSIEICTWTKRKSSPEDCQDRKFKLYRPVKRTRTTLSTDHNTDPVYASTGLGDTNQIDLSTLDFEPSPINLHWTPSPLSSSTSPGSSDKDSLWDQRDDSSDAATELSSQLDNPGPGRLDGEGRYFPNTSSPIITDISAGPEPQSSDLSPASLSESYKQSSPSLPVWLVDPELRELSDRQPHRSPRVSALGSGLDPTRVTQTAGATPDLMQDSQLHISEIIRAIEPDADAATTSEDFYTVDCLLDEWKNWFYVKWGDGSCSWQPRGNILDDELIKNVRMNYKGLGPGVEILRTRRAKGKKVEYRVHFKGRPSKEDIWVMEKFLSPELIENHKVL